MLLPLAVFLKGGELLYEEKPVFYKDLWWGTAPPAPIDEPRLM